MISNCGAALGFDLSNSANEKEAKARQYGCWHFKTKAFFLKFRLVVGQTASRLTGFFSSIAAAPHAIASSLNRLLGRKDRQAGYTTAMPRSGNPTDCTRGRRTGWNTTPPLSRADNHIGCGCMEAMASAAESISTLG